MFGEFFPALAKVIPALTIVPVAVRLLGESKAEGAVSSKDPTLQSRLAFNEKWSHFQDLAHDKPEDAENLIAALTTSAETLQSSSEPDPEKRFADLKAIKDFRQSLKTFADAREIAGSPLTEESAALCNPNGKNSSTNLDATLTALRVEDDPNSPLSERLKHARLNALISTEVKDKEHHASDLKLWYEMLNQAHFSSDLSTEEKLDQGSELLRLALALRDHPTEDFSTEDTGLLLGNIQHILGNVAAGLEGEHPTQVVEQMLARIVDKNDILLLGQVTASGLQKYVADSEAATKKFAEADKIKDPEEKRRALLKCLGTFVNLRDEEKVSELVTALTSYTFLNDPSFDSLSSFYTPMMAILSGSGLSSEQHIRELGASIAGDLQTEGFSVEGRARTLLRGAQFFSAAGDQEGLLKVSEALTQARDHLLTYIDNGDLLDGGSQEPPSDPKERLSLKRLKIEMDQVLVLYYAQEGKKLEAGTYGCDRRGSLTGNLRDYLEEVQKSGLPWDEKIQEVQYLTEHFARVEPMTHGIHPILKPSHFEIDKNLLTTALTHLFEEAEQELDAVSDKSPGSQMETGLQLIGDLEKVYGPLAQGKNPIVSSSVFKEKLKPLRDKVEAILTTASDATVADLKVSKEAKAVLSLQLKIHLHEVLSQSLQSGDLSGLSDLTSNYLSTFLSKVQNAEKLLNQAERTTGQEKFKQLLGAAQAYAELGLEDGVKKALAPLEVLANREDIPSQNRAELKMVMAQIYTFGGMQDQAKAQLTQVVTLDSSDAKTHELAQLSRGFLALANSNLLEAQVYLASIPQNETAAQMLKNLKVATKQRDLSRDIKLLGWMESLVMDVAHSEHHKVSEAVAKDFVQNVKNLIASGQCQDVTGALGYLVSANNSASNPYYNLFVENIDVPSTRFLSEYFLKACNPYLSDKEWSQWMFKGAQDMVDTKKYQSALLVANMLEDDPNVSSQAKALIKGVPDAAFWDGIWSGLRKATFVLADNRDGSERELALEFLITTASFGVGKLAEVGVKGVQSLIILKRIRKAVAVAEAAGKLANLSKLKFVTKGAGYLAEGSGLLANAVATEFSQIKLNAMAHGTVADYSHAFEGIASLTLLFGMGRIAHTAVHALGGGKIAQYFAGVGTFVASKYVDPVLGLKPTQEDPFWKVVLQSFVEDASMKTAVWAAGKIPGVHFVEQTAKTKLIQAKLLPHFAEMGLTEKGELNYGGQRIFAAMLQRVGKGGKTNEIEQVKTLWDKTAKEGALKWLKDIPLDQSSKEALAISYWLTRSPKGDLKLADAQDVGVELRELQRVAKVSLDRILPATSLQDPKAKQEREHLTQMLVDRTVLEGLSPKDLENFAQENELAEKIGEAAQAIEKVGGKSFSELDREKVQSLLLAQTLHETKSLEGIPEAIAKVSADFQKKLAKQNSPPKSEPLTRDQAKAMVATFRNPFMAPFFAMMGIELGGGGMPPERSIAEKVETADRLLKQLLETENPSTALLFDFGAQFLIRSDPLEEGLAKIQEVFVAKILPRVTREQVEAMRMEEVDGDNPAHYLLDQIAEHHPDAELRALAEQLLTEADEKLYQKFDKFFEITMAAPEILGIADFIHDELDYGGVEDAQVMAEQFFRFFKKNQTLDPHALDKILAIPHPAIRLTIYRCLCKEASTSTLRSFPEIEADLWKKEKLSIFSDLKSEDPARREAAKEIADLFSEQIKLSNSNGGNLNSIAAPALFGLDILANGHPTPLGIVLGGIATLASAGMALGVFDRFKNPFKRSSTAPAALEGKIIPSSTSLTPEVAELRAALRDNNKDVRGKAIAALGKMGAKEAIPDLILIFEGNDRSLSVFAGITLAQLGESRGIDYLHWCLREQEADRRMLTVELLGDLGAKEFIPYLQAALKDKSSLVRKEALISLGRMNAKEAIPDFQALFNDSDVGVRKAAVDALFLVAAKEAIPDLLKALRDNHWVVRSRAAEALGELDGPEAIPYLQKALRDNFGFVRVNAAEALAHLGDKRGISCLRASLTSDGNLFVRERAAVAVGRLREREAIPELQKALKDPYWNVRIPAAEVLGKMGILDGIAHLQAALKDSDPEVREFAAEALAEVEKAQAAEPKEDAEIGLGGGDGMSPERSIAEKIETADRLLKKLLQTENPSIDLLFDFGAHFLILSDPLEESLAKIQEVFVAKILPRVTWLQVEAMRMEELDGNNPAHYLLDQIAEHHPDVELRTLANQLLIEADQKLYQEVDKFFKAKMEPPDFLGISHFIQDKLDYGKVEDAQTIAKQFFRFFKNNQTLDPHGLDRILAIPHPAIRLTIYRCLCKEAGASNFRSFPEFETDFWKNEKLSIFSDLKSEDPARREAAREIADLFSEQIKLNNSNGGNLNSIAAPALFGLDILANGQPTPLGIVLGGIATLASAGMALGVFDRFKNPFKRSSTTPAALEGKITPMMRIGLGGGWTPRPYQQEMLQGLERDMVEGKFSWLALASPMQTGKSRMIPSIVKMAQRQFGEDTETIVLSSSRRITKQVVQDMLGEYDESEVGRFDGVVKERKQHTVASIYSVYRDEHLNQFTPTPGKKLVVVMDQAIDTQKPIVRKFLKHLGIAEEVQEGNRVRIVPKTSDNVLLVGLSGTAGSLRDYHVSGQLDLLTALEENWVRSMLGERIHPKIETQEMKNAQERMVWWKANETSAEYLTDIYMDKIEPTYQKNLVYVPTIHHGELLKTSLAKRIGEDMVHFVHSNMEPEEIDRAIQKWEENGGSLLSVRMLSHGFRAGAVGAVFHTYQSSSDELFSERTGRAWAMTEEGLHAPLYVLEATWDRERFSNLAKLLGLVDYPKERLEVNPDLIKKVRKTQVRQEAEATFQSQIASGDVAESFSKVPLLQEWREAFREISERSGTEALCALTGLSPEVLEAFRMGALPTDIGQVEALQDLMGGRETALRRWVDAWELVLKEVESGERQLAAAPWQDLLKWREERADLETKARKLSGILEKEFPASKENRVSISRDKLHDAFVEAIARVEAQGKTTTPQALAVLAHQIYCQDLPEAERPSQGTFRNLVHGSNADSEVVRLLDSSAWVKRQKRIALKLDRVSAAFETALAQIEAQEKTTAPQALANLAHQIYCQDLPKIEWPSRSTFWGLVTGSKADPEVMQLLNRSAWVERQQHILLKRDRVLAAFATAIAKIETQEKTTTLQALASLAHQIYCQDLPEIEWPSRNTFWQLVVGSKADPKVTELLDNSAWVERKKQIDLKRDRVLSAFERAIAQIETQGKTTAPRGLATLAYQIYCQGLPEAERPSQGNFHNLVAGSKIDPELMQLIDGSAWVKRQKQIDLKRDRVLAAFETAIAQIETPGKTRNFRALALLAHRIYCQDLPVAEHPSPYTFLNLTPQIKGLLEKEKITKTEGINSGKILSTLVGLGLGLSALLSPETAQAAVDGSIVAGGGGAFLGTAALSLMVGGIFSLAAKKLFNRMVAASPKDAQVLDALCDSVLSKKMQVLVKDPSSKRHIPYLLDRLKGPYAGLQNAAINGLKNMDALEALPALLPLLKDKNTPPYVLHQALFWLNSLKDRTLPLSHSDRESLVHALEPLADPSGGKVDGDLNLMANLAMQTLKPGSAKLTPVYVELLRSPHREDKRQAISGLKTLDALEMLPALLPLLQDKGTDEPVLYDALNWLRSLQDRTLPLTPSDRESFARVLGELAKEAPNTYLQALAVSLKLSFEQQTDKDKALEDEALDANPLFPELELQPNDSAFRRNPHRLYRGDVDVVETHADGSPHSVVFKFDRQVGVDILPAGTFLYFTEEGKLGALRPNQPIRFRGMDFQFADSLFLDAEGRLKSVILEQDAILQGISCAKGFPVSFDASGKVIRFKAASDISRGGNVLRRGAIVDIKFGDLMMEEIQDPRIMGVPLWGGSLLANGVFMAMVDWGSPAGGMAGAASGLIALGSLFMLGRSLKKKTESPGAPEKIHIPSKIRVAPQQVRIKEPKRVVKEDAEAEREPTEDESEEAEETRARKRR